MNELLVHTLINYPVDGKKRNVLEIIVATKAQRHEVKINKPFSLGALVPWWQYFYAK